MERLLSKDLSLTISNLFKATASSILLLSNRPAYEFPPTMNDTCFSSNSAVFLEVPDFLNSILKPDSFISKVA
jgi:hypothetical protein